MDHSALRTHGRWRRHRGRGVHRRQGSGLRCAQSRSGLPARRGRPPLNIKFLLEGEEEIGSPHLAEYVEPTPTSCLDLVISADGAMWRPSEPSLSLMSKGLVTFSVIVEGADIDLHSGRFGGTVANPLHGLSELVASLHTSDGAVAVEGFYEGVTPRQRRTSRRDRQGRLRRRGVPRDPGCRRDSSVSREYTTIERLWERPTLEINGMDGGGKYTVIPHVARAHISCRLVPGQDPEHVIDAIERHIVDTTVGRTHGARGARQPRNARVHH